MDTTDQTTRVLRTGCFTDERRCDPSTLQKMGRVGALSALRGLIDRQQAVDFAAEILASDTQWPESPLHALREQWEVVEPDGTFALHVRQVFAWKRADDTPVGSYTWDRETVLNATDPLPQERSVDPDPAVRVDSKGTPARILRYLFQPAADIYPGLWKRIG